MTEPCCSSPPEPSIPAIDAERLARYCKALGHPVRVRLVQHLAAIGECYFGELSALLPQAPSTISQHVSVLKEAGLILGAAEDQRTCYCVAPEALDELKRLITLL